MTASGNLGLDMAHGGSEWLFRQGELVLGPVPAQQIIEMLYSGELTGRSEIAPVGQSHFWQISEVADFKLHLAKAEAKHRVDAAAQAERLLDRKRRNRRLGIVAAICLVVAGAAAYLARYLAVHNPWKDADELAFGDITVEPPTITLAQASSRGGEEEDLLDYPAGGVPALKAPAPPPGSAPARTERAREPGALASKGPRASAASEEPDGLQTAKFDRAAINSVVAAKQRTLYACFAEEAQRTPGLSVKIPIEFVIGNDGRVSKLWVDNPKYKQGPLADCLLRELKKWPFKPYEGEQATVGLSFKIGRG